jgi:hypothetical protein
LPLKTSSSRSFYAQQCAEQAWSVRELRGQIERKAYERTEIASTQASTLNGPENATPSLVFKDPYFLDFLGLRQGHDEADLEAAILRQLEAWGLIRERNGTIEMLKRDLHLPRSSRVFPAFYTQRLLKSIEIVNRGPRADDYNFSVLISSSRETKAKLHARFLEFITAAQKEVGSGPEEEVYLMNFDLVSIP